ncbi:MAG: hypothetical protein OXR73_03270 [Myxococcales bacterium]|nr:hypothetical protein [Myxococcales bacterium]
MVSLEGHRGLVNALEFSPSGELLATGGADKTARVWEVDSGELVATIAAHREGVRALTFRPRGDLIATGSD